MTCKIKVNWEMIMLKKLSYIVSGIVLSISLSFADHDGYDFHRTFFRYE